MHDHHHHQSNAGRILKWSLGITVLFVIVETAAGFRAHSLALLSDAGHNFTDALALLLAAFGFYLQRKPADEVTTYGYHRAGVLTAFVNALTLLALSGVILYESAGRIRHPQAVSEVTMLLIASIGLGMNGGIMLGLRKQQHDLNLRAAFIHMLGDALGSMGIISGAIVIRYTGWQIVDPLLSIFIALLIVWTAWGIIKDALNILLEGMPRGLKLEEVTGAMRSIEGVIDVHDLHIWSLGSSTHALSSHILIDDMPPSESDAILQRINRMVRERYDIHHTTIQFEHVRCALSENGCSLPTEAHHERGA